jgi:hypothetical protein
MFLIAIPAGGVNTFGPLILKGFGFDGYANFHLSFLKMKGYWLK